MDPLGPSPTDKIVVLRSHVEEWFSAVDWARTNSYAMDLADSARNGTPSPKESRMTANLNRAYQRMDGYLVPVNLDDLS